MPGQPWVEPGDDGVRMYQEAAMDPGLEKTIIAILDGAKDMTVATIREDGYPQATTVSFAHDGLTLYFGCGADSQKARNLARNDKVSLTVDLPYESWDEIKGLSAGGNAVRLSDQQEIDRVGRLMLAKFPQITQYAPPEGMEEMAVFKVTPKVFSVLNYSKGFGHTDLVEA